MWAEPTRVCWDGLSLADPDADRMGDESAVWHVPDLLPIRPDPIIPLGNPLEEMLGCERTLTGVQQPVEKLVVADR